MQSKSFQDKSILGKIFILGICLGSLSIFNLCRCFFPLIYLYLCPFAQLKPSWKSLNILDLNHNNHKWLLHARQYAMLYFQKRTPFVLFLFHWLCLAVFERTNMLYIGNLFGVWWNASNQWAVNPKPAEYRTSLRSLSRLVFIWK